MSNADLERFYGLMRALEAQPGQGRVLAECTSRSGWPARGIYFFREPGECRRGSDEPRIVRVGTHAVSANAKSTLWSRLRTHRGSRNGSGNHRGSVFRRHIGAALLRRDQATIRELPTWAVGSSASRDIRETEAEHERRVSEYLGRMSVLWVAVPDQPGSESVRAYIERNAIGLLSSHLQPFDSPRETWLGLHSPYPEIRIGGLWNLNHVHHQHEPEFLTVLGEFVTANLANGRRGAAWQVLERAPRAGKVNGREPLLPQCM